MLKKNERRWTEYRRDGEESNPDSFKNNKCKVETRKAHKKLELKKMRIYCKRVKFPTNMPQIILKPKIREITRSKNSKVIRDLGKYLKLIKII